MRPVPANMPAPGSPAPVTFPPPFTPPWQPSFPVRAAPPSPADAARAAVAQSWEAAYGQSPNPAVLECLIHWALAVYQFDPAVLAEAINLSALRCADSPVDYIQALLRDWRRHKIRTPSQLEDYLESR